MKNQQQWNKMLDIVHRQIVFQLVGFDRLNFVSDVTNAVPQNEQCHITGLWFESDGVQAKGHLTVYIADAYHLVLIIRQLRSIRGLVSIKQVNNSMEELSV